MRLFVVIMIIDSYVLEHLRDKIPMMKLSVNNVKRPVSNVENNGK